MQYYLNKILASNEFAKQDHYETLLRYLIASTLKNEVPKEISIAMDIFNKSGDYDPALDSTVRVYVHNLRKKLQNYYRKEGKYDNIKISIPKGHYKVEFIENYNPAPKQNTKLLFILGACSVVLFCTLIALLTFRRSYDEISSDDPVWGEVLNNRQETIIVLGDHYFFKGHFFDRSWNIRDVHINSDTEFEDYLDTLSLSPAIGELYKYNKSYFPTRIPWSLVSIASIFNHHHRMFDLRIGSNFQWNEIDNKNIIYIGSFRGIGILTNVLSELIHYDSYSHELTMLGDSTQTAPVYAASLTSDYPIVDFALVIKRPGPRNNAMVFFLSTHDIGTIETTNLFSNMKYIEQFEKTYLQENKSKYFKAIFEVKGYSHSSMEHRLVYFEEIDS